MPEFRPWRLFLSYTGKDLKDHAAAVHEAARARCAVVDHVDWGSSGEDSVAACVQRANSCDALLVLVGHRKGWVPDRSHGGDGSRSICHIEWDSAEDMPRAGLLADPAAPWGHDPDPPMDLRERVQDTVRGQYFVQDPASIAVIAERAIAELSQQVRKRETQGRANELTSSVLRPLYTELPDVLAQQAPSLLLRAEYGVAPFRGREMEIGAAVTWCQGNAANGVRLLFGPGGAGKTRFAAELCLRMQRRGWAAGGLRPGEVQLTLERIREASLPVLIVVDYAETRQKDLVPLLEGLVERPLERRVVRILLLARAAGEWWAELARSSPDVQVAVAGASAVPVKPVELEADGRLAAFRDAFESYRDAIGTGGKEPAPPDLSGEPFDRMLWIQMAALNSAHSERVGEPEAILTSILDREARFWERVANQHELAKLADLDTEATRRSVCVATLAGAADEADGARLIASIPDCAGLPEAAHRRVARWLHALYPGEGYWNPVQPDLLAEALVARTLAVARELPSRILGDMTPERSHRVLTVMTRSAARYPDVAAAMRTALRERSQLVEIAIEVARETGEPMGTVLTELASEIPAADLARLGSLIPTNTVALREFAERAASASLAVAETPERRAVSLNNLSNRLGDLGRREQALTAIEEAVQTYRGLAEARPDAFLPDLAMSLNNLSNRLGDLGRREQALTASEEAVQTYRGLAEARPDAFRPYLALSLNNLSNRLGDLGRREQALAAIEEALQTYRGLAEARPDAFLPDLTMSLNNLSVRLGDLGRREQALAAIEEAVQTYRGLAEARPDAFLPDLAGSLNNLSNGLGDLGRREQALAASEEAVQTYRGLAEARPDAFLPGLAGSLNNLCLRLGDLGRREQALAAIEEAVQIRRGLAEARPDAFLPDLAMSLNNLSVRLGALGRREHALAASEEAVQIRRGLAEVADA